MYKRQAREVGNDEVDTFIIPCDCPRFQSGDAKGLVKASTRGDDLYIFVDPGNYSVTYKLFGYENHLSPDDHFQNLMRIIQAVSGRAHRISVIMPSLYGGRQHRRVSRESLDCAFSLQQLRAVGVKNIITFDAHDPRVMNAVPTMSFDNVMPTYQVLKCLLHHVPDVSFHKDNFMIVSPDEGAMNRNMYYSSVLGCNLGMFYKRRDYSRVVNGRNPIVAHEYLGESVEGKDVFIGVSAPNIVTAEMVASMANDPIVFAMANPTPEIMPEEAKKGGVRVMATGRSDYPNQINNVLVFPGIFRGALDAKAKAITEEMKIAAAKAIASIVTDEELNEEYIIPGAFDERVAKVVAKAVSDEAKKLGIVKE